MRFPWQKTWLDALEKSLTKTVASPLGDELPAFPPDEVQIRTVGLQGKRALREAAAYMESCVSYFKSSPQWQSPDKRLLDFGTGWGRIARCFLRDFKGRNIVGIDVDPSLLEMCRANFSTGQFLQSEPLPPLRCRFNDQDPQEFPASGTDFIVAYSVFSHLSQQACQAWVNEFHRILSPGGMVAATTRGRWFFDTAQAYQSTGATGYHKGLAEMFEDFDEARARYDAGQLVHANSALIGDGQHYGETFIPEGFVREHFGQLFEVVAFHQEKRVHPVIILRKRA